MSVDESLMCSFQVRDFIWRQSFVIDSYEQILKPSEKKPKYQYGGLNSGRPLTPPRAPAAAQQPPTVQGKTIKK